MGTQAAPRASFNSIKKSSNPGWGSLIIGLSRFQTETDTKHSAVRFDSFRACHNSIPKKLVKQCRSVESFALLVYDMFFIPLLAFSSGPRTKKAGPLRIPEAEARASCFARALCAIQDKLEQRQKL